MNRRAQLRNAFLILDMREMPSIVGFGAKRSLMALSIR